MGLVLAAILVVTACGRPPEPVARLVADPRRVELGAGRVAELALRFEILRPLDTPARPLVFVHLRSAGGEVVRTFDHPLPAVWDVESVVVDELRLYHSALGPPLPPGSYALTVGIYDGGSRRWALAVEGDESDRMEYRVAEVVVPEASPVPVYTFSEGWQSASRGTDAQVVARRWLVEDGEITLSEVPGPGRLWMSIFVPEPGGRLRLLAEDEATEPAVRVTSGCSGFAARLAGFGAHEVAVPVTAVDGSCRVTLDASFHLVEMETLTRRSLALEQLGWEPGTAAAAAAPVPARADATADPDA